LSFEGFVPFV